MVVDVVAQAKADGHVAARPEARRGGNGVEDDHLLGIAGRVEPDDLPGGGGVLGRDEVGMRTGSCRLRQLRRLGSEGGLVVELVGQRCDLRGHC